MRKQSNAFEKTQTVGFIKRTRRDFFYFFDCTGDVALLCLATFTFVQPWVRVNGARFWICERTVKVRAPQSRWVNTRKTDLHYGASQKYIFSPLNNVKISDSFLNMQALYLQTWLLEWFVIVIHYTMIFVLEFLSFVHYIDYLVKYRNPRKIALVT